MGDGADHPHFAASTHCLSCLRPNSPTAQHGTAFPGPSFRPLPRESPSVDELHLRRAPSSRAGGVQHRKTLHVLMGSNNNNAPPASGSVRRHRPFSAGSSVAARRRAAAAVAAASVQEQEMHRVAAMIPEPISFDEILGDGYVPQQPEVRIQAVDRAAQAVVHGKIHREDRETLGEEVEDNAINDAKLASSEEMSSHEVSGFGALPQRPPVKSSQKANDGGGTEEMRAEDHEKAHPQQDEIVQETAGLQASITPIDLEQQRLLHHTDIPPAKETQFSSTFAPWNSGTEHSAGISNPSEAEGPNRKNRGESTETNYDQKKFWPQEFRGSRPSIAQQRDRRSGSDSNTKPDRKVITTTGRAFMPAPSTQHHRTR